MGYLLGMRTRWVFTSVIVGNFSPLPCGSGSLTECPGCPETLSSTMWMFILAGVLAAAVGRIVAIRRRMSIEARWEWNRELTK